MEELSRRKTLVTGGAGFIGYHLSAELAKDPTRHLVIVDNFSRGHLDLELEALVKLPNVQLISGDLINAATFDRLGTGYDEVYHLAGVVGVRNVLSRPRDVIRTNVAGTLHLLEWFTDGGGEKLVFSSTSEVYGWTQQFHPLPHPTPEDVPLSLTDLSNPRSSYAGSKILGELAVIQYCKSRNKSFVILRYHNVYGPRMGSDHVIPELYLRASSGQDPLVVYSPDHTRAFCYVTDAVSATILAMRERTIDGWTVNVGNDLEELAIYELARRVLDKAGIRVTILPSTVPGDPIVRRCPDISRARQLLGYRPQVVLDEGLDHTLKWYASTLNA